MSFDKDKPNQILLGDCLKILNTIPDHFFDLVVTDPPFYVMNKPNIKFKHRTDIIQTAKFDGFASYDEFINFTQTWVSLVQQKMKPDASMYIFFGAQYISDLYRYCLSLGFKYKGIIVWHKTNPAPKIRKTGYLSSTEQILFVTQGKPTFNFLGQNAMHNFIQTPICMRPERIKDLSITKRNKHPTLHPTQKPEAVIKKLVQVSSDPGSRILDPFTGTGTTNKVCLDLNRLCVGIESNPKYVSAAVDRLNMHT